MTTKRPDDPRIERTRARALEATLEIAASSGIHACTFDAVSEHSGIARSTLYRHWSNQAELVMDALESQRIEFVAPDTGNLRDDMLAGMLGLAHGLEHSVWGALIPQLLAAASIDPQMRAIQKERHAHYTSFYVEIVERAKARGEVPPDTDAAYAASLFTAPVFARHLEALEPIDARWITAHVDQTAALLRHR
ncbi:MAG: TetR/AcrR family transcriptional regulator [Chloroflexota bacterium]